MKFKVGDKVKVVSLENTRLGDWKPFAKTGLVGEVKDILVGEINNVIVEFLNTSWAVSLEDLYLVSADTKITDDGKEYLEEQDIVSLPVESDGGSSSYYFTKLPHHVIDQIVLTGGVEIKDIARYVYDNDADAFNIIKAEKRIIEAKKGKGKAGIDMLYDANKIKFFAHEQYEAIKQGSE